MAERDDVLVLGHGLAAAAWVEECWRRGLRACVIARPRYGQASRVAAGVVNPVVLRRYMASWRGEELLDTARAFYRAVEVREQVLLWHAMPMLEIFPSLDAIRQWAQRRGEPPTHRMLGEAVAAPSPYPGLLMPLGHGPMPDCAWLDVTRYLDVQEQRLRRAGAWVDAPSGVELREDGDGVHVADRSAPLLVRCEGPFAQSPGLVPVRGENLLVEVPGLALPVMAHRGVFLLPQGDDRYRVGATFKWDGLWEGPSVAARTHLLGKLRELVHPDLHGGMRVLEQLVGVRPASRDRRPLLGRTSPRQALMNGLGARGVIAAPWSARHLAAHLFDGQALDPEVDLARVAG